MLLKDTNIGRLILDQIEGIDKTASKSPEYKHVQDASKISQGLIKVANIPYKEGVHNSVKEILKIASECINELKDSLDSVTSKSQELEKAAEVRVLIDDMLQLGVVDDSNLQEKVAELMSKTAHELDITREAIKLNQGGDMGSNLFEKEAGLVSNPQGGGMFDSVIS